MTGDYPCSWCYVNLHLWSKFNSGIKSQLLNCVFERFLGEPFESLRHTIQFRGNLAARAFPFPSLLTYVLAPKVERLRDAIQEARDQTDLAVFDHMVRQLQIACQSAASHELLPYIPGASEKDLIARLMEITQAHGYLTIALPPILVSAETPPLFVAYPELEDDEDHYQIDQKPGNQGPDRMPRDRERKRPDTIYI